MKVAIPSGATHGWGIAGNYLSREIAKLPKVDGVTLHCIEGDNFRPFYKDQWDRINIGYCFFEHPLRAYPFIAETAKQWDHIVAGSSWCEEHLRRGGMERASTILQGIDSSRFSFHPPRADDGRFIVFSGGKFEFRKGQDIVIAAMRIFMERHKDVWLSCSWHNHWPVSLKTMSNSRLIHFNWDDRPCSELLTDTVVHNGLDISRVLLHPPFDNSRMALIYAESDVGVFPNRCEGGNNMVMSEYMACGRTVIASNQTGHADVVTPENAYCLTSYLPQVIRINDRDTAIWPEPSPEELLEMLERAYDDRKLLHEKAKIAARDMSLLTWGESARQFHALAARLTGSHPTGTMPPERYSLKWRQEAETLFDAGSFEQAEACYRKLIDSAPLDASLHNGIATVLDRQGRYQEALAHYHKAVTLAPDSVDIRCNIANTLARSGSPDKAIDELKQLLTVTPHCVRGWKALGYYYIQTGRPEEALRSFDRTVQQEPDDVETWAEMARLSEGSRDFQKAVSFLDKALAITPENVGLLNSKGLLHHELEELEHAESAFRKALAIEPDNPIVCNNMGNICKSRLKMHEAIEWYDKALEISQGNATIFFNRALAYMTTGDLLRGWEGFESRFDMTPPVVLAHRDIPLWTGESLKGKRLLIQSEQVYGDTFMFCRFVDKALQYGGTVVFECQDPSIRKALVALEGKVERLIVRGEPLPDVDVQIPLLSLPGLFDTSLDSIPLSAGYLSADPATTRRWGEILSASDETTKVGLVWGGRKAPLNANRSLQFKVLEPLLDVPGIRYFSLQLGEDLLQIAPYVEITDLSQHLKDFGDTAAAIANLDLVITIDTAVAHLAGAMGKPVWVLLKYSPDWRWLLAREDSPWYSSARLFRQKSPGDWAGVVTTVVRALGDFRHKKSVKVFPDNDDNCIKRGQKAIQTS